MNTPPAPTTASSAVAALVLGICGIIVCPICAPIAWSMGRKAEREIEFAQSGLGGRGLATAGRILGVVGTILLALYVVFFIGWVVLWGFVIDPDPAAFDTLEAPR